MNEARMMAGGSVGDVAVDKPTLQVGMDQAVDATRTLEKIFAEIDGALNRLTMQPPRVAAQGPGRAPETANPVRLTVEGRVNGHVADLRELVQRAQEVLTRLNRAV